MELIKNKMRVEPTCNTRIIRMKIVVMEVIYV